MRTMAMVALALTLTLPAVSAQQAGTQAQQEAQRRELREKMRELQQQMRELEREMARLERETRGAEAELRAFAAPRTSVWQLFESRGRLGVTLNLAKNAATDSIGAVLAGVTPSGPADRAGLRAGDIITTFNGERLTGRYPAAGERESEPLRKLWDFAQQLEEGDTVVVDYRRGKETHRATIVAKRLGSEGFSFEITTPDRIRVETALERLRGALDWSSGWLDVELVKLNPELGDYFGTTEGLLVIRAPADSELQVKGGDVILSVDGRPAASAAQLMRVLRSYEPGEDVKLDIMRQKRRMTLTVKVPERRTRPDVFEHQWDSDWNGR